MPNVTTSDFIAPHLGKNPRRHPWSRLYLHKSTYSWNIQFAHLRLPRAPHIITITSSYLIEAKVLICHIKKRIRNKKCFILFLCCICHYMWFEVFWESNFYNFFSFFWEGGGWLKFCHSTEKVSISVRICRETKMTLGDPADRSVLPTGMFDEGIIIPSSSI